MVDMRVYQDIQNASQPNVSLLNHIGLVKRVALHLKARLPNFMELEELIQVGMIGLIEADKSFDASKGVDFEIFAKNRIRGAILDQVRKMSYLPRSAIVN
ncbi:MAG TPA: FliA/WhiG family RNA polymerase sigma factor, partial [Porticoccaceae bacterium]|nr:FliA/WhiG family RNA polymerase sigma factor [Porticoccaceae bacterium]